MKAVEVKVHGLKCDAEGCGYRDDSISLDNPDELLDRPCPKCGTSLLSKEDLALLKMVRATADWANVICGDLPETEQQWVRMRTDGSGGLKLEDLNATTN